MEQKKKNLSEARLEANKRYLSKFADFKIRILPEERDQIQQHAKAMGESATGFVKRAIRETMERDQNNV